MILFFVEFLQWPWFSHTRCGWQWKVKKNNNKKGDMSCWLLTGCYRMTCCCLVISVTFLPHENRGRALCLSTLSFAPSALCIFCLTSLSRSQFFLRWGARAFRPTPTPCFSHYMFPALWRSPDSLPSCRAASHPLGHGRGWPAMWKDREREREGECWGEEGEVRKEGRGGGVKSKMRKRISKRERERAWSGEVKRGYLFVTCSGWGMLYSGCGVPAAACYSH